MHRVKLPWKLEKLAVVSPATRPSDSLGSMRFERIGGDGRGKVYA
jgi:hypothetical protein